MNATPTTAAPLVQRPFVVMLDVDACRIWGEYAYAATAKRVIQ